MAVLLLRTPVWWQTGGESHEGPHRLRKPSWRDPGIAERVAGTLTAAGLDAEIRPLKDVGDSAGYAAFVIGSAVYMFHW